MKFQFTVTDLHTKQTAESFVEYTDVESAEHYLTQVFNKSDEAFMIAVTQQANGAYVIAIKSYIKETDPHTGQPVKNIRVTHLLKSIN